MSGRAQRWPRWSIVVESVVPGAQLPRPFEVSLMPGACLHLRLRLLERHDGRRKR